MAFVRFFGLWGPEVPRQLAEIACNTTGNAGLGWYAARGQAHHGATMQGQDNTDAAPAGDPAGYGDGQALVAMSMFTAADLQDHLLSANNDLERLQALLTDACNNLLEGFYGATEHVDAMGGHHESLAELSASAREHLRKAITALQFQDMASQLIAHTQRRLRNCSDRLAREAFAGDDDGDALVEDAPLRPNPVTQAEMDVGSIELF